MTRFRGYREVHKLSAEQAEYHAAWYIPAIRELAARADFDDDPRWIARTLQPSITTAQAQRALTVLHRARAAAAGRRGRLRQAAPIVTTGVGPLPHHVVSTTAACWRAPRARSKTSRATSARFSSLTLCVSHEVMLQLKERVRAFRRELLHFAEQEGAPERVVQINFQLFPMSRKKDENDE